NACFALYWSGQADKTVAKCQKMAEVLRRLTELLYYRDSRVPFCPEGHWIMVSEAEMADFAEYAVAEGSDDGPQAGSSAAEMAEPAAQPQVASAGATSPFVDSCKAILRHLPFVIPFGVRLRLLRSWIARDREKIGLDTLRWIVPANRVEIRRDHIIEDGFTHLNPMGVNLKKRIQITFISDQGLQEAGIDGGARHLQYMAFVGRVVGKALYEGILMDVGFAGFFLAKWLGRQSYLDDLRSLDEELYKGLLALKNYPGNVEADFSLNFTVAE
ncbi:hypothetical protein HK405_014289, partial [Cladochytrium tenue]